MIRGSHRLRALINQVAAPGIHQQIASIGKMSSTSASATVACLIIGDEVAISTGVLAGMRMSCGHDQAMLG